MIHSVCDYAKQKLIPLIQTECHDKYAAQRLRPRQRNEMCYGKGCSNIQHTYAHCMTTSRVVYSSQSTQPMPSNRISHGLCKNEKENCTSVRLIYIHIHEHGMCECTCGVSHIRTRTNAHIDTLLKCKHHQQQQPATAKIYIYCTRKDCCNKQLWNEQQKKL